MGGMKAGFNCCLKLLYYFIKTNYLVKQAASASFQHIRGETGLPGTYGSMGIDRGPGSLIRLRRAVFHPPSCGEFLSGLYMCTSAMRRKALILFIFGRHSPFRIPKSNPNSCISTQFPAFIQIKTRFFFKRRHLHLGVNPLTTVDNSL